MSDSPATPDSEAPSSRTHLAVEAIGRYGAEKADQAARFVRNIGGTGYLLADTLAWCTRGLFTRSVKLGRSALTEQMVRVGVKSVGIVMLVQVFIGCILALQLAPTLESYGQIDKIADVVAIAIVRELGPLITAIVLSGFAGASIAAEIAAMVESEEIKALRAHAINPIRFLIVPRFLATAMMIVGLAVIADVVGVLGGLATAWAALGIAAETYIEATRSALVTKDFITGLIKAAVFGMLISMIACREGLTVKGGAVGVGNATTATVVKSIVAIIGMDAVFTATFWVFEI